MGAEKSMAGRSKDLVVFEILRDSKCTDCGEVIWKGEFLFLDGEQALCLSCADLDHLEYLPRGDAALTRRAKGTAVFRRWLFVLVGLVAATNARVSWSRYLRLSAQKKNVKPMISSVRSGAGGTMRAAGNRTASLWHG
jgi:hypothetical protein